MRALLLLLPLLLATFLPAQAGHKETIPIYLRIYLQTSGEGLPASQVATIPLPPDGDTIQIRTLPELTERELIDVKPGASGGVRLMFDHQGTINLNAITAQNIGRLLVVMINGVVVYAPMIDEQLNTNEFDLPHPLSVQVMQLLKQTADSNVLEASKS